MKTLVDRIKSVLGRGDNTNIGCRAVVDEETGELCRGEIHGESYGNEYEVKYCKDHIPSDAMPQGGRTKPLTFYIPEEDTIVKTSTGNLDRFEEALEQLESVAIHGSRVRTAPGTDPSKLRDGEQ